MISARFLEKLDVETLIRISEAQVDELIERRDVHDPKLFKDCFEAAAPTNDIARVRDFSEIASTAFDVYHKARAEVQPEDDAPETADDADDADDANDANDAEDDVLRDNAEETV